MKGIFIFKVAALQFYTVVSEINYEEDIPSDFIFIKQTPPVRHGRLFNDDDCGGSGCGSTTTSITTTTTTTTTSTATTTTTTSTTTTTTSNTTTTTTTTAAPIVSLVSSLTNQAIELSNT